MSIAALHASAFYKEVAETRVVWGIRDCGGYPAPQMTGEKRSMPFWSSESRALNIIETVDAYKGFEPVAIPWSVFIERWVPGLTTDSLLAGVNWSGPTAVGYDVEPRDLQRNVEAQFRAGV